MLSQIFTRTHHKNVNGLPLPKWQISISIGVLISFSLYIYNQQIKFALWSKTSIHTQDKTAFVTNASHHILAKCAHKEKTYFFFWSSFFIKDRFLYPFWIDTFLKRGWVYFPSAYVFRLYAIYDACVIVELPLILWINLEFIKTKKFFHIEPLRKLILKMFRFLATTSVSIKIEKALVRTITSHSEGPRFNLKQFFCVSLPLNCSVSNYIVAFCTTLCVGIFGNFSVYSYRFLSFFFLYWTKMLYAHMCCLKRKLYWCIAVVV